MLGHSVGGAILVSGFDQNQPAARIQASPGYHWRLCDCSLHCNVCMVHHAQPAAAAQEAVTAFVLEQKLTAAS